MALAGIATAISLLFVGLSVLVRFSTVAFFIAASVALMAPMSKRYYASSVLAYVVTSVLGFFIAGDIGRVAGFVVYFGPMALITGLLYNLKVKQFVCVPVKLVYINGALALMYFVLHTIVISADVLFEIPYWVIAIVGSVILLAIDFVLQFVYSRLIPLVDKAIRSVSKDKKPAEEEKPSGGTGAFEDFEEEYFDDLADALKSERNEDDEDALTAGHDEDAEDAVKAEHDAENEDDYSKKRGNSEDFDEKEE